MKALERFQERAKWAQGKIDEFKLAFDKDPAHALEWADGVFEHVATLTVANRLIDYFADFGEDESRDIEAARTWVNNEVMIKSRNPPHSSSDTSNLLDTYILAAWASAYEILRYMK